MSRGKRYSHEPKLNKKKVAGVILIIVLIVAFIIAIKALVNSDDKSIVSTTYFTVYTNNKWGVIDNNANIVIEPTYDEMIIIPNNKKDVFICTQDVDYTNNTYTAKVINSKNSEILKQYENVQAVENYDEYNNLWYEENILKFEKDGKYGLIDLDGNVLLEASYEDIYALKGTKEAIITKKDEKLGVVNLEGSEVVPNEYTEIKSLGDDTNLYIVKKDDSYGVYGKLDTKFQNIKQLNSKTIFCVKENDKYKVINEAEEELVDFKFDDIKQIKEDVIVYTKNKKYGAYNTSSKEKIDAKYQELEYTSDNNFIVKNSNSYGIVDIKGNTKQKIEFASIEYYDEAGIYELEPKNNTSSENIVFNNKLTQIAKGVINEVNASKSYIRIWTEDGYKYYNFEI